MRLFLVNFQITITAIIFILVYFRYEAYLSVVRLNSGNLVLSANVLQFEPMKYMAAMFHRLQESRLGKFGYIFASACTVSLRSHC